MNAGKRWKPLCVASSWRDRVQPTHPQGAARQLRKLDPPVAKRIIRQISWLAQHFDELKPEALKGDLAGLFKYREGDYRIIYEPIPEEKLLVIHEIGHRSEIYKKSKS